MPTLIVVCADPPMSSKALCLHKYAVNIPDLLLCHNPSSQVQSMSAQDLSMICELDEVPHMTTLRREGKIVS